MYVNFVDFDFIDTYGIEIKEGRKFSRDVTTDLSEATVVNESFLRTTGITDPIGKIFTRFGRRRKIIGVMGDFNFLTLHSPIEPVTFQIDPSYFQSLSVKLNSTDLSESVDKVIQTLNRFSGDRPIEYYFLDNNFNQQYQSEEKLARTLKYFTYVAIFVACLGLYGLVSFGMGQRVKEIGIRKVLGSTVTGLTTYLTMDFVKPVIFANLAAWPVAYYLMERWMENFAYHTNISLVYFIYSGGLTLLITLLLISAKTIKAANANPIDSLRYE